ncbi:MAG: CsbD family protein [Pseudonocardiaceae bacterium]
MNTDKMRGTARETVGGVKSKAGEAIDDSGLAAEGMVDQAIGGAQRIYGQAKDTMGKVADDAAGLGQAIYDEHGKALERQVSESPFVAVAIGAAMGFVLARLL